jgi:hypothetical protein
MTSLATYQSIRCLMQPFEPRPRTFLAARLLPIIITSLLLGTPFLAAQSAGIPKVEPEPQKSITARGRLRDFDIRSRVRREVQAQSEEVGRSSQSELHESALRRFQQRFSDRDGLLRAQITPEGLPASLSIEGGYLSEPSAESPVEVSRKFLLNHSDLFRLSAAEIEQLRVLRQESREGLVLLRFTRSVEGLDVFESQVRAVIAQDGRVAEVGMNSAIPGLRPGNHVVQTPVQAVQATFEILNLPIPAGLEATAVLSEKQVAFRNPMGDYLTPVTVELCLFPLSSNSAVYAYRELVEIDGADWYEIVLDAESNQLLFAHNLYRTAAGRVWKESPVRGTRELTQFGTGWLPEQGQVTTGNNVDAYLDTDGNNQPDPINTDELSAGRAKDKNGRQQFDFETGDRTTLQNPRNFKAASVTNLFYFVNLAHDYFYKLGFDEKAGNFQKDNFGRGGTEGDPVLAEAQDAGYANNAAMSSTPEGVSPRMQAGLFTYSLSDQTSHNDSAYDGMVTLHEYTHGVADRIIGGGKDTSCLMGVQSGAMGEGWADYFGISYYGNPIASEYLSLNPYKGIRRSSYDRYPYTYEDLGNHGFEVHRDGEIWAATLWDLRKAIGQQNADQLIVDGFKFTPCHPSMISGRDAILTADDKLHQGANRSAIWKAFAARGMGQSAGGLDGDSVRTTIFTASYDLPTDLASGNRPPKVKSDSVPSASMGAAFVYQIQAQDPDGGTLRYEFVRGPAGMTVDATSGIVRWTATFESRDVLIAVSDDQGGRTLHGFALRVLTPLQLATPIKINGSEGFSGFATVDVTEGTPVLQVTLRNGSGDPDLWLYNPDGMLYSGSFRTGTAETLSVALPKIGTWFIEVDGYRNYKDVSLAAALITPEKLNLPSVTKNLQGNFTGEAFYMLTVPSGQSRLDISTSSGSGDVDIFVRRGAPALVYTGYSDWRSRNTGTSDQVSITNPAAADYYILLYGSQAYSGVTLKVIGDQPLESITATPSSCAILPGENRCTVTIRVTNLEPKSLQVWVKGPQDSAEKAATGVFTSDTLSFPFEWCTEGNTVFNLYQVTGTSKTRLSGITVIAQTTKLTVAPSTCTVVPATGRCAAVTVQGTNPEGRSLQIMVKGPADDQEKAMTGVFTSATFSFPFGWIVEGTTTFYLYDVGINPKRMLSSATAIGRR